MLRLAEHGTPVVARSKRFVRILALVAATALLAPVGALSAQAAPAEPTAAARVPVALTVEGRTAPADVENLTSPVLAWQPPGQIRPIAGDNTPDQVAYNVVVATTADAAAAGTGDVLDSGKVESSVSTGIAYDGPALVAGSKYWFSVKTWNGAGTASDWTDAAGFGTALGKT